MTQQYDIKGMVSKIKALRKDAEDLKKIAGDFPAVEKNIVRILADVKLLEINISDVAEIQGR
jgi:hypothetical protein